jgi:hypothetical protein
MTSFLVTTASKTRVSFPYLLLVTLYYQTKVFTFAYAKVLSQNHEYCDSELRKSTYALSRNYIFHVVCVFPRAQNVA